MKQKLEGTKNDDGKVEFHHFPPEALNEIAKVFSFGGKKYGAYNFRVGLSYSRVFNALMRHSWAWWRGEDLDPESGLSHLAHAGCCVIMLLDLSSNRKEFDDRYRENK